MPIKLPKGFQRRKSSGNALDEVHNPPDSHSSFRVLDRPANKGPSFDGGIHMRMASAGAPRPPPKGHGDHEEEDLFSGVRQDVGNRGSGGTERSLSTAPYDSGASSTRLSISSTNPSSVDTRSDQNVQGTTQKTTNDLPVPPSSSAKPHFLRSPGRTFSFGITKGNRGSPTSSPGGSLPALNNNRNRAVTTSTASTATPPRLFDSDLALDKSELDGFGNMFDHIGSSPDAAAPRLEPMSSSPTTYPPTSYPGTAAMRSNRAPAPSPIRIDRAHVVDSSPYSWTSHDSREGLIRSPSPSKTITQGSPAMDHKVNSASPRHSPVSTRSTLPSRKPVAKRTTSQEEDIPPPPPPHAKPEEANLLATSPAKETGLSLSPSSTHSATFDPSIAADAQVANLYQDTKTAPPKPVSSTKVMTPAQWEQYKQQKEMDRRLGALSDDSSSEDNDEDEDEDEIERDRRAAKQRRKQEAHLAVYRQQMMKVTGEKAPSPGRPDSGLEPLRHGNGSSMDLDNQFSHLMVESKQSGKSSGEDEDEDEDVPLGILAAHGFPNKNRPPTRLSKLPSNPNLRSVSQSQGAPSVVQPASKAANLPAFARHLPPDPYYGASLVNAPVRESLSIHPGSPALGAGPATAHPMHPAGLVGVIAGEERARAARRGSPNASGTYDAPGMPPHPGMLPRSQTASTMSIMGYPGVMPGMPAPMSAGEQAQLQMSQQMSQMMQMQMQWMQQMQQMMVGPMPAQPGMPPAFGQQRPQSVHMQNPGAPPLAQRTMSALNPGMASWNPNSPFIPSININGGNYAPSIAPSERSNIGLASRYRPVSVAPEPEGSSTRRASTFTSSTFRPWSQADNAPRTPMHGAKPSVNAIGRRSPLANQEDEDDEEGWAEMKKKKEKKQKNWALRKGQNPLQELYPNTS
ncbi:hypothetical protein ABEF95_004012 [Exophiala dermatitidis]